MPPESHVLQIYRTGTSVLHGAAGNPPPHGRNRVIVEKLLPEVDGGLFPIKRTVGESVAVEANIFADGHDVLSAVLLYRRAGSERWLSNPMELLVNDHWRGNFTVLELGTYEYTVEAWVNHFRSWRKDLEKKYAAGQDVTSELQAGLRLIEAALNPLEVSEGTSHAVLGHLSQPQENGIQQLQHALALMRSAHASVGDKVAAGLTPELADLVDAGSPPRDVTRYRNTLKVTVDPVIARFSSWYELFPRSCSATPGKPGTLRDCQNQLSRIAELGFDVVYLPPIHPIGHSFRKGRNNSLDCAPSDPGSPWAIGSAEGGHKSIHPELGTLRDFQDLVKTAGSLHLEIALDIAFQCSPDHPYVKEHPEWFKRRPDGSIQYAENPPKKYQDIYPLNFECDDWWGLWQELKSIFEFWHQQGVRIFRVDNPHTKSLLFWEWCLGELKASAPELVFLSEAFTRPKIMYYLAKAGFTQSYNYFPWRNTRYELTRYFTELTTSGVEEFFRPNLWPNTPDILPQYLQFGGKPAFMARLILAATLGASYGIYGPPYELCENAPREPGSEEYLNSEKYEIRHWDFNDPRSISGLICRVNRIRREHPALQSNTSLRFHEVDNEQLIAYSKQSPEAQDIILVVVNLDPHHTQRGWLTLGLEAWGLSPTDTYQVHELLTDARYLWTGTHNYVELNPTFVPAHVFRVRRYVRTERDFDYFI